MSNYTENFQLAASVLRNLKKKIAQPTPAFSEDFEELCTDLNRGLTGLLSTSKLLEVLPNFKAENSKDYRLETLSRLLILGHNTEAILSYEFRDYSLFRLKQLATNILKERSPWIKTIDINERFRRWETELYEHRLLERLIYEIGYIAEVDHV